MRKFVIIILCASSITATANPTNSCREQCNKVLNQANEVIKEQDNLNKLILNRNIALMNENERLTKSLMELSQIEKNHFQEKFTWGAVGVSLGIILGVYLTK